MKRFLVVILGALLVTAAASAGAQGLSGVVGRGRDEGRGQDQAQGWTQQGRDDGGQHNNGWQASGDGQRRDGGDRDGGWQQRQGDGQAHNYGYGFGTQGYTPPVAVDRPDHREQRQTWGQDGRRDWTRGDQRWNNGLPNPDNHRDWSRDDRRDWGRNGYNDAWRHDSRHNGGWRDHNGRHWNSWRDHGWRQSWSHGWNGHRWRSPSRYYYPRGYGYRSWTIGYRLPSVYYAPSYYIDWRYYGLSSPPWGCYWVRIDRDVLLVETASGEVVDILYGFFY